MTGHATLDVGGVGMQDEEVVVAFRIGIQGNRDRYPLSIRSIRFRCQYPDRMACLIIPYDDLVFRRLHSIQFLSLWNLEK